MTGLIVPRVSGLAAAVERDGRGALQAIRGAGRCYVYANGSKRVFDDGFVEVDEVDLPRGRLRSVRTAAGEHWVEEYEWDAAGRPVAVDGVAIARDAAGRVVACAGAGTEWRYAYEDGQLTRVSGPRCERRITRGPDGRPLAIRTRASERRLAYTPDGSRRDVRALPRTWHRDALGRLVAVTTPDGEVLNTWLWDGPACLGRIDGPLGEPLAAVFSLDPSLTPVRAITREGSLRLPRDAFGESLLDAPGVPGLFGGAVRDGFVHLRSRALDPVTGSWHAPDPWHGLTGDPRRGAGYEGPLVVEAAAAGPYAICRNDPIGRSDATGEVSIPLILSTFTHSHANNLLGIFGLDLTLNFWGCLLTGQLGRFFSMEGLSSSSREGSFGMRRDGWVSMGNRAWTFQHLVWASAEHIDELQDARVFDPCGAFEPDLYGTLLRVAPASGQPFVLRGSSNTGPDIPQRALGWSRAGGVGKRVVPGSPLPRFPDGGIHFDRFQPDVRATTGTLAVLRPTGAVHQGTLEIGSTVSVTVQSLPAPDVGRRVVLVAGSVRFASVKESRAQGNRRRLLLELEPGGDPPGEDASLRGVGAESEPESMSRGSAANRLVPPAGRDASDYKEHALALAQGGTALGVRLVTDADAGEIVIGGALPGNPANPYDVRRSKLKSPGLDDLSVRVPATVKLAGTPPPRIAGGAVEIQRLTGATVVAGTTQVSAGVLSGTTVTAVAGAAPPRAPTPSQVVLLRNTGGAGLEPAVVKAVKLAVTLDRDLTSTATSFEAVPLEPVGPSYRGIPRDASTIVVRPDVGGIRTEMPRFGTGEIVEVGGGGLAPARLYRVADVAGTTLTLAGDAALPAPPAALTVQRVLPSDPGTGGSRAGVHGRATGPRALVFDVWAPNGLPVGAAVGIDDGTVCHPARIASLGDLQIELFAAPTVVGRGTPPPTVDVQIPGLSLVRHAATLSQSADVLTVEDLVPPLDASPNVAFVVPFERTGQNRDGTLGSGTVLVPDALEAELDRRASLVEHELRHTIQSATWGPFLLCYFPLNVVEGLVEAASDVELPEWGPYVAAELVTDGGGRFLQLPAGFSKDDTVQVSSGGRLATVQLGEKRADGRFQAPVPTLIPDGHVSSRRGTSTTANTVWTVVFDILELLTYGGLLNLLVGATWGSLFFLVGHGFHALGRLISGSAKTYPAAVEQNGSLLRLADADGRAALAGASRVSVTKDDTVLVRDVASVAGDTVQLAAPVDLQGDVDVAPYSLTQPDSLWDWHEWFPVTFPDESRPASLRVEPAAGKTLELRAHDRVSVSVRGTTNRTNVTAVAQDGTVELEEVPGHGLAPGDVRIAKVGENDPIGNLDSALLTEMGQGWMRWLFDPYGQIQYRQDVEKGSFWDVVARVVRFLLSTQSYSAAFPGWWVWDNALKQRNDEGHLSRMEQDASQESGDLYSTLARLDGNVSYVGDVARYWIFEQWRRNSNVISTRGDAPGVHLQSRPRLIPFRTAEAPAAGAVDALNRDSAAPPVPPTPAGAPPPQGPADALPDAFAQKSAVDPRDVPPATPRLFAPTPLGFVPTSPKLERSVGMYVAFSRPTEGAERHRVTAARIPDATEARKAQDEGKQRILYDRQVLDVTVKLAGVAVAEGSTLELVATQRARLAVEPNSGRRYAVTVPEPSGATLGLLADGELGLEARGTATAGVDPEPVEISRLHAFVPDTAHPRGGSFSSPALSERGLNLPVSVHVPVRRFSIDVVTRLPFRSGTDLAAPVLPSAKPGEHGFLIVPTDVRARVRATFAYPGIGTPVTPGDDPRPVPVPEAAPDSLRELLSHGGGVVKVSFPADDPPEERAEVKLEIDVGRPGNTAVLAATVVLEPHFRLALPAAATDNHVARGATITLTCDGATPAPDVVVDPPGGVTATVSGQEVQVAIAGNTRKGPRRILVTDTADAARKARRTIEIV